MSQLEPLLPLVALLAVFWFLLIRPQQRRNRELRSMQQSLKVGDEVMLTSGVFCVVEDIEDDHVRVEIAPDVTIKVARGAIGGVVSALPEPEAPAGSEEN